ncbi:MAG: response regulator transcription factor [Planctomycetota bacterium]
MRVLIVEDEIDLAQALAQGLREEGYAVDIAYDGEDAAFKALAYDYDALVLDIMLPKLDGRRVLERLRCTRNTPVLILSARGAVADRVAGLDLGADDYLAKPFSMHELLARVRAMIRRSAGRGSARWEIGDVIIDCAKRSVWKNGVAVGLTRTEYALVGYLAMHRGRVVSRTELFEHLFDENEDSLSNLLDVHVSNVRKKLGADFIITRRGHGYLIDG